MEGIKPHSLLSNGNDRFMSVLVSHWKIRCLPVNLAASYLYTKQKSVGSMNRTSKVAKTRYNDHGDHHNHKMPAQSGNVLRKMTMNATELFRLWQSDTTAAASKGMKKRSSPSQQSQSDGTQQHQTDVSPQRFAFSQLALGGSGIPQHSTQQQQQNQPQHADDIPEDLFNAKQSDSKLSKNHGLLSAVIENSSQTSSLVRENENGSILSKTSTLSKGSSIATKSSIGTRSLVNASRTLPQGKCLTQPSTSVSNEGLDNAEGNLIVHEHDVISVSRKKIQVLTRDKMPDLTHADFRIQGPLGQGTFAQVFECLHFQTGKLVAVKIVKNKPAYTRQAAVEIDVFRALTKKQEKGASSSQSQHMSGASSTNSAADASVVSQSSGTKWDYMVDLVCYFMYKSHLCLVFELLGLNLYEVLKRRQFRGLPLTVVRSLVSQAVGGTKELAKKNIVHCDLKPENILLVTEDNNDSTVRAGEAKRISYDKSKSGLEPQAPNSLSETPATGALSQSPSNSIGTTTTIGNSLVGQKIKLIDFGSACFEGQSAHTYIQSRFYRSPEVLIGLPYDSAIDMWSLGCVAAELFLGLPILPGLHEHDQLSRICEMIANIPDWMLDQGSKASKYFVKYVPRSDGPHVPTPTPPPATSPLGANFMAPSPRPLPQWRIRTQQEYIASLSQSEVRKKGGLSKLEKQPTNRYFKRKKLADIIMHKGQSGTPEDKETLELFIHFLYGKSTNYALKNDIVVFIMFNGTILYYRHTGPRPMEALDSTSSFLPSICNPRAGTATARRTTKPGRKKRRKPSEFDWRYLLGATVRSGYLP